MLATLIDAYEAEHFPIDLPDPIAAIEFRMEQQELSPSDLVAMIGPLPEVVKILERKRSLSLEMIRRLHLELGIDAGVLIRPIGRAEVA